MRLFAAVLPPGTAVDELAEAVAELKDLPGADRLRWTGREGWHFTLAFYGEVGEEPLPELYERLARAARRHEPHGLRIAGSGRFGDRVVWAGAAGEREAMRKLAGSAAAGARRAGVAMEEARSFTPHLTIARGRADGVDLGPYAERLADFEGGAWTARELTLVRSHPPQPGVVGAQPRYETVAAWPLGRGAGTGTGDGADVRGR